MGTLCRPPLLARKEEQMPMAEKKDGRIVETASEARQAEPGPSIPLILIVSLMLALILLGALWFVFFRT
jgi:hypothetical protein